MYQLKSALRSLITVICQVFGTVPIPQRPWMRVVRKPGQIEFPTEARPAFISSSLPIRQALEHLPQTSEVVQAIKCDPLLASLLLVDPSGQPLGSPESERLWIENNFTCGPFFTSTWNSHKRSASMRVFSTHYSTESWPTFKQRNRESLS